MASRALADYPYTIDIRGLDDSSLKEAVESASQLEELKETPTASPAGLERRVREDAERIMTLLRSRGYYGAKIDIDLADQGDKAAVTMNIAPGDAYPLTAFRLHPENILGEIPLTKLEIELGKPVQTEAILGVNDKILAWLSASGRPLAKILSRNVIVDHEKRNVSVDLTIDPGPLAHFGPLTISNAAGIERDFLLGRLQWPEGERFDPKKLDDARQRLMDTQLFSTIRFELASQTQGPDDSLPVTLHLTERDARSIGFGVGFSTAEGADIEAFWEHRNLFAGGEKIRVSTSSSAVNRLASASYRDPDELGIDRDILADLSVRQEDTEAFEVLTFGASAGVEVRLSPRLALSGALALERTIEDENERRRTFTLISTPLEARFDTTNDALNPTTGGRTILNVRPFLSVLGSDAEFIRSQIEQTLYRRLLNDPEIILAGWARVGAIFGSKAVDVPADKRFYAGGAGSVRGYGYQLAGPVDANEDPIGGRSLASFGGEGRIKITETIGIVPFIEAGNVYTTQSPRLDEKLFWGTGLGLRYHTPLGPVRADFAIPLDRRPGIDDPFQVYISLGQAF